MNNNLTEVVFILDMSGSMSSLTDDTIGGFNSMLRKQKENKDECLVSAVLFNDNSEVIYDREPINQIKEMTTKEYCPCGCTALIDALGGAIKHIKKVHRYIRKEDVPNKTVFIITTDGYENASRKYSSDEVKKMVSQQKEEGWEFIFLGANIDAAETAKQYGISEDRCSNYINDKKGVKKNYDVLGDLIMDIRTTGSIDEGWNAKIKEDYNKRK